METEKTKIHAISEDVFAIEAGGETFSLSTSNRSGADSYLFSASANPNWEYSSICIGSKRIVPYGLNNDLPIIIRDMMQDNNLAPGILRRQLGLLFGQGAFLYRDIFENGEIRREWVTDKEIVKWLDSWSYMKFIEKAAVDFLNTNGFFCIHVLERGHRIGQAPRISHLKFVSATKARLEWADSKELDDVKHIFVGDFENNCYTTGVKSYKVYNPINPAESAVSASYNYSYSYGRSFYSTPAFMGAFRWILRGSDIPLIFKYVTDNGLNLAYHIHSPFKYWEEKKRLLQQQNPQETPIKIEELLAELKGKVMSSIAEVLSGKKNAGKFFESVDFYDSGGNLCSWKIEAVDQKFKDFVESQLQIGEAANSAITSGMQLHPSLTNIMVNGKLASGSEMLYALKIYLLSDIAIPEMTILDPINQAIKFNFNTDLKLGFYHKVVMSEESVTSEKRVKNSK